MHLGNRFSFGILTLVITFCFGFQCGTKLSLKASIEPTLYPSKRMQVKNMFQCDTACRRDPNCVSVNYDYHNRVCDLNTFQQRTYNSHSKAKNYLQKHCQKDKDKACADCGQNRRCVRTAEGFKCFHGDITTPLAVVDCGPPGVVPNGNVNYNTTSYSSQGQIICNPGYNFSDVNNTISCTTNSTWDFLLGSCQAVDCGTPPRVHNGISLYNSTTYGSLCYLACNPGFTGLNETITCRADGYWENVTASCEVVDCGPPGVVPNGNVNYNTTTYSSQGQIICNPGYNFSDVNNSISCTTNSTWDFLLGSCQAVDCGTPARVHNGISLYNSTTYGSLCYLACNSGFTGLNETITCRADGYWENVTASCEAVSCGSPPVTPFGTFNYSSTTYGSPSHLLCNTGYIFHGTNSSTTCRADGTWDSISGNCEVVNCGSPVAITNGVNNCSSNTTYGSLCDLTCNTGYVFTGGNNTITCSDDGSWETYTGSCVVDCGTPIVENAVLSYNGTMHGSRVKVTCVNDTFIYNGDALVECNEHGKWARLPFCRKNVVTLDDWVLLLRVKAGNGISVYDLWRNETIYHDHPVVPEDLPPGCISLDTSLQCDTHFKSKLVTEATWNTSNIQQVKVLILESNEVKAEVLFNGERTTRDSWFSKAHFINSTWTDLKSATEMNYFSIQGHKGTTRRFYINSFFKRCPGDTGWMLIKDISRKDPCDWEKNINPPAILFSKATTATLSGDFGSAHVMAVLAKLGSE